MYKELEAYHKKYGHANVPSALDNKLARWVGSQRANKLVRLTAERIARLDKLDFRWAKQRKEATNRQRYDKRWLEMYEKLKAYHEKHGHSEVPFQANAVEGNFSCLGLWCRKQRADMRQNNITPERRGRMEDLGFNFELQSEKNERIWNERFQRLEKYKLKHGDCLVPSKNTKTTVVEDSELSYWVTLQRGQYKRGTISNHRIQKLEDVGFVWSIIERERLWDAAFQELTKFREEKGHTFVRRDDDMALWRWTKKMKWKRNKNVGTLTPEREERLESIGFWDPPPQGYRQRGEKTEKSEERDEEICSSDDDDARKPPAKRRRTTSTEWLSEDNDDRKLPAKNNVVLRQQKLPKNTKRRQSSAKVPLEDTLS
jgi:hypothetical protein